LYTQCRAADCLAKSKKPGSARKQKVKIAAKNLTEPGKEVIVMWCYSGVRHLNE
jgi:hypothetical protein